MIVGAKKDTLTKDRIITLLAPTFSIDPKCIVFAVTRIASSIHHKPVADTIDSNSFKTYFTDTICPIPSCRSYKGAINLLKTVTEIVD